MEDQAVIHSTFVIERSYPKPPERVFAAFADPAKKRRWFGESENHQIEQFEMNFEIGGAEKLRYRLNKGTPVQDVVIENDGTYQLIIPNKLVVTASRMTFAGKTISAAMVTVELLATDQGTNLICTYQGAFFEGSDGPQRREGGWRALFDKLDRELAD